MVLVTAALVNVGHRTCSTIFSRCLHTTIARNMDQGWRMNQGLPENPNSHGPLTDRPDYSFKDGRPTPLGARQLTRLHKQREIAEKIIKLVGEINVAEEKHKQRMKEKEEKKQKILSDKLKPKGKVLLDN